jgi:hypothetical protein
MPDATIASLMQTIAGGLIAMSSAVIVLLFQSRKETKKRRAEKFEELVSAVYEHDHWIDSLRRIYVVKLDGEIKVSPFAKIRAISDIYFPQFRKEIEELDTAAKAYRQWMYEVAQHAPENKAELLVGHQNAVGPYMERQNALHAALRAFSRREFR